MANKIAVLTQRSNPTMATTTTGSMAPIIAIMDNGAAMEITIKNRCGRRKYSLQHFIC